jgi:hypothetical protein
MCMRCWSVPARRPAVASSQKVPAWLRCVPALHTVASGLAAARRPGRWQPALLRVKVAGVPAFCEPGLLPACAGHSAVPSSRYQWVSYQPGGQLPSSSSSLYLHDRGALQATFSFLKGRPVPSSRRCEVLPAAVTSALRPRTALSGHLARRRAIIYNKISSEQLSVASRQQGRRARHVLGSSPREPGRDGQHIHRVTREALLCSRRSGLRLCVPAACMHGLASLTYQHCTPQALGRLVERPWTAPCSRPCACLLAHASAEPHLQLATRPTADGRPDAPGTLERAGSARAGSAGASGARAGFQPYQAVLCLDSNGAPVDHFCPQSCGVQDAAAERTGARRLSAGNAVQARSDDDALDHLVQVCRLLRRMPGERSSAYAVPQQVRFLFMVLGRPTAEIGTADLTASSQERPALSAGRPGDPLPHALQELAAQGCALLHAERQTWQRTDPPLCSTITHSG